MGGVRGRPYRAAPEREVCLLAIRELAGVLLFGERLVIHSAHEWRTVSEQFTATLDLIEGSALNHDKKRVRRTGGEESITFTTRAAAVHEPQPGISPRLLRRRGDPG